MERYAEAVVLYQEFEERHPTNEAIPYVMYQKAMSGYNRIDTDRQRRLRGHTSRFRALRNCLRAFPDSPYRQEARARIAAANEFLVNHEFYVVKFYLRTEKYLEAETRLKYLLAMYPDAKIAPRAQEMLDLIQAGTPPTSGIGELVQGFIASRLDEICLLVVRREAWPLPDLLRASRISFSNGCPCLFLKPFRAQRHLHRPDRTDENTLTATGAFVGIEYDSHIFSAD